MAHSRSFMHSALLLLVLLLLADWGLHIRAAAAPLAAAAAAVPAVVKVVKVAQQGLRGSQQQPHWPTGSAVSASRRLQLQRRLDGAEPAPLDGDAAAAAAASISSSSSAASRRLASSGRGASSTAAAAVAAQCEWDEASQACDVADAVNVMYAIRTRPASAYLWFLLATYDREEVCTSHRTRGACNGDAAHRCVWFDDVLAAEDEEERARAKAQAAAGSGKAKAKAAPPPPPQSASEQLAPAALQARLGYLRAGLAEDLAVLAPPRLLTQLDVAAAAAPASAAPPPPRQAATQRQQPTAAAQQAKKPAAAAAAASGAPAATKAAAGAAATPKQQQQQPKPGAAAAAVKPAAAAPAAAGAGKPAAAASASKKKHRSSSTGDDVLCASRDMLENYAFTRGGYASPLQAPLPLHCPGSRAYELSRCLRLAPQACRADPGCAAVAAGSGSGSGNGSSVASAAPAQGASSYYEPPTACVSAYVRGLDRDGVRRFMYAMALAEPAVVGTCDGACWMRQALLCNRTADRAACGDLSFCRPSASGACVPRLYGQDDFGSSVQEYMGECADADSARACGALQLRLVRRGAYGGWAMPAAPSAACPLPSIVGGVLQRQQQQQQPRGGGRNGPPPPPPLLPVSSSGARVAAVPGSSGSLGAGVTRSGAIIAPMGAAEEHEATAAAAAAAAAAATRAAQLVSNRGLMGLRLLFDGTAATASAAGA